MMAKSPASDALAGTPASAGSATGTVRVILDPVGAHLEPGKSSWHRPPTRAGPRCS